MREADNARIVGGEYVAESPVCDSFVSGSAENVVLANDYGRVVISPGVGGSLRSLRVRSEAEEIELLAGGGDSHDPEVLPSATGSFVMAPWVNRILNGRLKGVDGVEHSLPVNSGVHAIRGTLRRSPWDVIRVSDTELECRIALSSPWPWSGSVSQTIALIDHSRG